MTGPLELAVQHLQAGRFAESEAACRDELRQRPGDLRCLTILGVLLHRTGRMAEALVVCREAVDRHPEAQEALGNLAVLLQSTGQAAQAQRCLARLLTLDPASGLAMQRLGVVWQMLGDLDNALRHCRRSARLDPLGSGVLFNLGTVALLFGDPSAACAVFSTLIAAEPNSVTAYAQLGATLLALGFVDRAATCYERAFRIDPANEDARDGRMRCLRYRVAVAASTHGGVPEGLLVRGPYQGISGYAHMTNRLVDAMSAAGLRVHRLGLLGTEPWASPLETMVRGRSIVSCQTPSTVEKVPGLMTVNLSMFEGTRIPQAWRRFSDKHDLVIVPTESSRVAWVERNYPEDRIRVCPLGVDAETINGPAVQVMTVDGRSSLSFRCRFLNVSDFIPRKNLDGVLRVWLSATSATDDAVLILKLGKGGAGTGAAVEALFRQTEVVVGKRRQDAAPVAVVTGALDEASMTGLFRTATHYWSLSHGEGWDLPMSKAGAMGLQLIAPAHSSYVDYLDRGVARMIPSTTGPAHLPNSRESWPTFHGLNWWEPDETAAAQIINRIVRGEDQTLLDARHRLLERFTWAQASEKLTAILRDVGAL